MYSMYRLISRFSGVETHYLSRITSYHDSPYAETSTLTQGRATKKFSATPSDQFSHNDYRLAARVPKVVTGHDTLHNQLKLYQSSQIIILHQPTVLRPLTLLRHLPIFLDVILKSVLFALESVFKFLHLRLFRRVVLERPSVRVRGTRPRMGFLVAVVVPESLHHRLRFMNIWRDVSMTSFTSRSEFVDGNGLEDMP